MKSVRTLFREHLDVLSYYLTIFAVGAAGVGMAFAQEHPQRMLILVLVVLFALLSLGGFTPAVLLTTATATAFLLAQTVIIILLVWVAPEFSFFVIWFFMTSVYAVAALPPRYAYAWIAVFSLVTLGVLTATLGWAAGLASAGIYISGFAFFAAFARLTRRAESARQESEHLLAELQEAHRALQEYAQKVETLAISEERNRLAREMHDTLGHRLTVSAVQLEAAERLIATRPERAAEMVATVRAQVRAALTELRQTVAALRQPLESDLPLENALRRLCADFQQATGLEVHLDLPASLPALSAPQRLTLYRAAQEGLTNAQKHAAAKRVWVRLAHRSGEVVLGVRDDGRGPQEGSESGFGLRGLRERASRLGGEVRFGPAPEGGALLEVILPL